MSEFLLNLMLLLSWKPSSIMKPEKMAAVTDKYGSSADVSAARAAEDDFM